jgi:hypothetical protein
VLVPFINPNDATFPPLVAKHFEAGSNGDDMLIPWHDEHGELVAYLVRSFARGDDGRYDDRWRDAKPPSLYNLHRVRCDRVVITTDVYDVWHAYMSDLPAVAFHGRWLPGFADDLEEAGVRYVSLWMPPSPEILDELAHRFFVRYVDVPIKTNWRRFGGTVA